MPVSNVEATRKKCDPWQYYYLFSKYVQNNMNETLSRQTTIISNKDSIKFKQELGEPLNFFKNI